MQGPRGRPWGSFPIHQHWALSPDPTWKSSAAGGAPAVLSVLGSSVRPALLPPKVQALAGRGWGWGWGLAKLHNVLRVLPIQNQGNRGWRGKAGLQGRPCKAGRLGPTPLKRELSAQRFLGMERGDPGGPNSRLTQHRHLWPHGLCSHSLVPSSCRRLGDPYALGSGDSESLRPRGRCHTPRATFPLTARRGPDVLPPPPARGPTSARIRYPHWPRLLKEPITGRALWAGRLSLEGLGGCGKAVGLQEEGGRARSEGILLEASLVLCTR